MSTSTLSALSPIGETPSIAANRVDPSEKMSDAAVGDPPRATSGAT
nr:hypothetical protein [Amycolatopsis sp.]